MDNSGSTFRPEGLTAPQVPKNISISEAAKILHLSEEQVGQLVKQEVLQEVSPGVFKSDDVARILESRGATLTQEAAVVGSGLQRALNTTFGVVRAVVTTAFAGAVVFGLTVAGIAVAYTYFPNQVASYLNQKNPNILQGILQPAGNVALGILKFAQPTVYQQVTYNTIGTLSDIFTVKNGRIYPTEPLVFPQSSYLNVLTSGQIANLNASQLQGRVPGTTVGNIAIEGQVTNLADNAVDTTAIQDGAVTNAKLSQITDANKVAGSAVQLNGNGGLTNNTGLSLLTSCSNGELLKWNSTNSKWECQADAGASGSGITAIQESGSTVVSSATEINFADNDFIVTETPATVGYIQIDYANSGITQKNVNQTISATWSFPSGTVVGTDTFTSNAITDSGALTIKTTTNGALTLDSGTIGAVNLGTGANSKTVSVGSTTGTSALNLSAGSGGVGITGATTFNSTPITLAAGSTIIDMTGAGTLGINITTNRAITTGTGLFTAGGALTATGALISSTSLTASGNLATPKGTDYPTTGAQNNVNLGNGMFFRYTGVASAEFTGISGGTDGRILTITNASSSNLTLDYLNGGSSASNQIVTPSAANLTVGPRDGVTLQYDSGASLWRVVGVTPSTNTLSGIAYVNGGNGFGTSATLGTTDANTLAFITSGSTRFTLNSAAATLTGTGATTLTSTGTLSLTSAAGLTNGVTINSGSTGPIQIGSDADNETVQVGAGAGVKNATFGSTNTTSTTTIAGGTGGIGIGDFNNTKTIRIGGNIFDAADTVRIATNSTSADTLQFGNNNSSTSFSLTGGNKWSITSGGVVTVIGAQSPDITSTAGNSLTIDSGTTGALNFGTGANAKTVTIGNTTGATVLGLNAGSGGGTFVSSNALTLNPYGVAAGNTTSLRFSELAANGTNYVGFKSPDSISANVTWILPAADGSNSQVLTTDGLGNLNWSSPGACATCFVNGGNSFAGTATLGTNDANDLALETSNTTRITVLSTGNVGVGDTSPASLFTVGSGDKFQIDTNGNVLKINNVTTSFPASQGAASTVLTNDGAGNLTWSSVGSGTSTLNAITAATGNATINNTNWNIGWNWSLTGATNGFDISEPGGAASTGTGYLLRTSTIATSTAKPFSIGARGTTIFDTTATGGLTFGDSATLNTPITLQSGTGAINIGTDAVAHTITLGNVTGATSLVLNAGTGNIDIGTTAQARSLNFGTGGAAQTVTVGSTNGASSLTLDSGTGALNIGTTIAKTVTIGNTTGATAVDINSGSGGINFGGATTITGSNTFTTGTGTSTFNSTLLNLAGNSTVIDMSGTGTLGVNTTNNAPITTGTGLFTTGGATTVDTTLTVIGNFITPKGTDYVTTGTSNDTNFGAGSLFRYAGAGTATFTGIAGGADGRFIRIMNASASNIVFNNADAGSAAANQILTGTGSNVTISPNISVGFQYDSGVSRWRLVVLPANSATVGTFAFIQGGNAFGATASLGTTDANILSLITGGASRFQIAAGASTLTGQGTTTLTSTGSMAVSSAAGSALNLTSGTTGTVTLDSGSTGDVVLGAGASAKNIKIGGTGDNVITIGNLQTGGSVTVGNAMTTGTITIGGTAQTGTITLGSSSGTNIVAIGNGAGTTTVNIANTTTDGAVSVGAGLTSGTIQIGGTGAQTGTITIGGGTGAQTVNLATGGTGVKTVHIADGTAANVITIGTGQTGGSIALGSSMTTGTIDIGNSSGAMTGTINIGGSTGAQTLNFGGGSTGIKTINIGGGTAANVIAIGNAQTGGSFSVGSAMTNGTISLGGSAMTGAMTFTTGTGVQNHVSGVTTGSGATSAFVFNASALTSGTALRLTSTSASGLLFDQNATNTSGTIDKLSYGAAASLAGALTGLNIDLSTNLTATGQNLTGMSFSMAGDTNIASAVKKGISITQGAITENTGAATGTNVGMDITMGALTLTSGTALNSHGLRVTTGNITQTAGALDENGILIDSTGSTITTGGVIDGIEINGPTTIPSVGKYYNISLGTSTGSVANTQDVATIAVGNIASTATNNFSTLNITNGGTGYLDVELLHGFINMRGMNTLYDDFTGKTINTTNTWTATATGGGSACAIGTGTLGGQLVMTAGSGGANRACEVTTQAITTLTNGYYQRANNPVFETRVALNPLTNDTSYFGFTDTRVPLAGSNANANTNHAYIGRRSTDANWQCITDDGGATESYVDTGVAIVAGTFYRMRVEVRGGTTPETICTVDDGTTITKVTNTANQPGATSLMDVYLQVLVNANTTAKTLNVDYVRVWQDDPALTALNISQVGSSLQSEISTPSASFEATPTATPETFVAATDSATFTDQVAVVINNLFNQLVEFFGKVIFHQDVSFLAHVLFGVDSAGHALVKAGDTEFVVNYKAAYNNAPVVALNVYITGAATIDQIPPYAIYDNTVNGFKIKLARPANFDIDFGWTAVEASGEVSGVSTSGSAAMPSASPAAISAPEDSPTPVATPEATLAPAPPETPTPSPVGTPVGTVSPSTTATATPASPAASPTPP